MGHEVFVSYSTRDRAAADAVHRTLHGAGLDAWLAPDDIPAGRAWDDAIVDALGACRAVVLLLSAASDASPEVRKEVALAAGRRLPILPLRLEPVAPTGSLAYHLVRQQWLDAFPPLLEPRLDALVAAVRRLLDGETAGGAAAPPAPAGGAARLPAPATPLVGREAAVAAVAALLGQPGVRLVTLTGPGGVGKTRLGVEVAARLAAGFADGVSFVPLAGVAEPALVLPTVAAALGLRDAPGRTPLQTVADALRGGRRLLVLDNFEQVLGAREDVAALLRECPDLTVLATSRARLQVRAEREFTVAPLAAPDAGAPLPPDRLNESPAVALFVERARAVRPDFALNEGNAAAVAEICRRLDGLPLAIELAAARSKLLAPPALLARLGRVVDSPGGGPRDLEERQRTLAATVAWSHDLLGEPERTLFRRLGVFAGGGELAAIEAVADGDGALGVDVLDGLGALVDHSLLLLDTPAGEDAGEPRFRLLRTIREYALERLDAAGEGEALRRRHAEHFLALAEGAEPDLGGPDQRLWLDRLEREHDNLRAALAWAGSPAGDTGLGLRLAGALARFWDIRGHFGEGRRWLEGLLDRDGAAPVNAAVRGKALQAAGRLAYRQGDYGRAEGWFGENLDRQRTAGDQPGIAGALHGLGSVAYFRGDFAAARAHFEASLAIERELGREREAASALNNLGAVAHDQGDLDAARDYHEASLAGRRRLGDRYGEAASLNNLGNVALARSDLPRARALFEASLALKRELGDRLGTAASLNNLGNTAYWQGDWAAARALFEEAAAVSRELGDPRGEAASLDNLGHAARSAGEPGAARTAHAASLALRRRLADRAGIAQSLEGLARADADAAPADAARWLGAADACRESAGAPLAPSDRADLDALLSALRDRLGPAVFDAAHLSGRALPLDTAAEALATVPPPAAVP